MSKSLNTLIAKAPQGPGIYKFLNEKGEVLYVGKAKSLRKRLQGYFRKSAKHTGKNEVLMQKVEGVEWIETNSEVEALILEDNLIKTHQPKYNVLLKDDKNYQYIKITIQNDYPEVLTVRQITKDKAKYFGPKTSGSDVQRLMESARRIFKLCSQHNITLNPKGTVLEGAKVAVRVGGSAAKRPCLDFHIKRCTGPCAGMVTPDEYQEQIAEVLEFLSGNYKPAVEALRQQMMDYAAAKKFERAAALRDQIAAIKRSAEKQLITDTNMPDRDVIGFVEDLGKYYFNLFQIRGGKLIGQEKFILEGEDEANEVMESFMRDYYAMATDFPPEVVISVPIESTKLLEAYITQFAERKVKIIHPKLGHKDHLVNLAEKNARTYAQACRVRWEADTRKAEVALEGLQKALDLEDIPNRIECYDISHLGGTETVGSMVVFKKGESYKPDYRQFRLRSTANKNDDFKSMQEVISRRLNYLPEALPKGYKLEKAKKKDIEFLESHFKGAPDFNYKQYYVIRHDKDIVATGRIHELSEKVHRIASLWVSEKERGKKLGHFIMKKLIDSSKQKRLYLHCHADLEEYYQRMSWETLKKAPDELTKSAKDEKEPLFMAYQKKKKDTSFTSRPDLIVIDGGKGQLSHAYQVLKDKGQDIPMISLAKKLEEVFLPEKSDPINLPKNSEASYLLQRVRDEAHRFAIEHNRSSRNKKMTQSALDEIPGVGPKMKKRLLQHFGSVHKLKEASQVAIEQIAGEKLAKTIKESL